MFAGLKVVPKFSIQVIVKFVIVIQNGKTFKTQSLNQLYDFKMLIFCFNSSIVMEVCNSESVNNA